MSGIRLSATFTKLGEDSDGLNVGVGITFDPPQDAVGEAALAAHLLAGILTDAPAEAHGVAVAILRAALVGGAE